MCMARAHSSSLIPLDAKGTTRARPSQRPAPMQDTVPMEMFVPLAMAYGMGLGHGPDICSPAGHDFGQSCLADAGANSAGSGE